ncbi:polyprotein [Basavirus sp.]|nr:polyprotein [Basavirus sp.]
MESFEKNVGEERRREEMARVGSNSSFVERDLVNALNVEEDCIVDAQSIVSDLVNAPNVEFNEASVSVNAQEPMVVEDDKFEDLTEFLEKEFDETLFDDLSSSEDSDCEIGEDFIVEYFRNRVRYIIRNNLICSHYKPNEFKKCACMSVYRLKHGRRKYYFDELMLNDIKAILYELRMGAELKTVPYALISKIPTPSDYIRHKGIRMLCASADNDLECDPRKDRIEFLQEVYELREFYGIFGDKGEADKLNKTTFEAQGIPEYLKRIWDFITSTTQTATDNIIEVIKACFKKILEIFESVFGFISDSISKVISSMFVKLRHAIIKWVDPIKAMKDAAGKDNCFLITCVVTIAVCLIIDIIGILSYKLSKTLIDKTIAYCQHKRMEGGFFAQGPQLDATAGLVTLVSLILGLSMGDMKVISDKCKSFMSVVSAGLGASWLAGSLFMALPIVVQTAIKMKFGSREEKDKAIIDDWLEKSMAVIRLKKIPQVLVSEDYYIWIRELVDSAMGLKSKIKSPMAINLFTRNLVSIMDILNLLDNYRLSKSFRDYPFSIHISAPPGYGKTLLTSSLVRDLFSVGEVDIFDRPVSSEFWDGFIGQKVVIFDEFLIGDKEYKMRVGKEYLEAVSTKVFKPPLASVDNPQCGIKGTVCEPIGVVTINNSLYEKVEGIPCQALWRRREAVIELKIAQDWTYLFANNKVDLSKLTAQQIKDKVWLKFNICSPEPNKRAGLTDLTYQEMMTYMLEMRRKHMDTCDKIREGRETMIPLDRTPKQMLEDALRELKGVPNEPIGIMDSILQVLGDFKFDAFAQGNKKPQIEGKKEEDKTEENVSVKVNPEVKSWAEQMDEHVRSGMNECTNLFKEQLLKISRIVAPVDMSKRMEGLKPSTSGVSAISIETSSSSDEEQYGLNYAKVLRESVNREELSGDVREIMDEASSLPPNVPIAKIMDEASLLPPNDPIAKNIYNRINKSAKGRNSMEKLKSFHSKVYKEVSDYIDEHREIDFDPEEETAYGATFYDVIRLAAKFNFYVIRLRRTLEKMKIEDWVPYGFNLQELYNINCHYNPNWVGNPDDLVLINQKETVTTLNHEGVDPTKIHRHRCHGLVAERITNQFGQQITDLGTGEEAYRYRMCNRQFAHKHPANEVHDKLLCADCARDGVSETFYQYHSSMIQKEKPGKLPVIIPVTELLPREYDYDYVEIDEETRDKLNKKYLEMYLAKFVDFGQIPLVFLEHCTDVEGDNCSYYYSMTPQDVWIGNIKAVARWVSILSLVYAVRKLFFSSEKPDDMSGNSGEVLCFSQSARPTHVTRVQSRVKRFAKAQAADIDQQVVFTIRGVEARGIPIKGKIFLTYYHAFYDGESMVAEGTKMLLQYGPHKGEMELSYSLMMVDPENDLAFVSITDNKFPAFPNNTKRFLSINEVAEIKSTSVYLPFLPNPLYATAVKVERRNYSHREAGKMTTLAEAWQYKCPTKVGDCGTMVKACGEIHPGKILGMHVAGGPAEKDMYGLAVIITKEDIVAALSPNVMDKEVPLPEFFTQGPIVRHEDYYGPNVIKVEEIPYGDQIFVNRVSKIKRSCISKDVPIGPFKNKPILSANDKRNFDKVDPLKAMMKECCSLSFTTSVDYDLVKTVFEDMYQYFDANLTFPFGKRTLTFEEALKGVPGKLCSMKVNTSAGFPLCKLSPKKGKTAWFGFSPNGELHYETEFKEMVDQFAYMVENKTYDTTDRRFLAFLKDELVTDKKIHEGRNRVIYSGDLISNTYYRMMFGSLIAAFNNSYGNTSSAIGINQYSYDMHLLYNYLTQVGNKFIAGDFKNLDKLMHPIFKRLAYDLLMRLVADIVPKEAIYYFQTQQMSSPVQIEDVLVWLKSMHFSGLFLTTIINNVVHEGYIRYVFARLCPNEKFSDHMRIKLLGDDHIYCVSDYVMSDITPFNIREELALLGQVYTSDNKDQELKNEFRNFNEITFLGAHPVMIDGQYCGAMKKNTLIEMLHWTRNNNMSLREEIETAMDLATVWDREFFDDFVRMVKDAINNAEDASSLEGIKYPLYYETRRIVALRTAASGLDFPYNFTAQGPGLPEHSITNVKSGKLVSEDHTATSMKTKFQKLALNEVSLPLTFGTESTVYRDEFEWKTSDVVGTAIKSYDVPFGLLNNSTANNLQNMPFERFLYWKGDVKVVFQVNATPFQCGMLAVYFVPLAAYEAELPNITTCSCVMIQPDQSATYEINIPFMYLRSVMNTRAKATESLGTLYVTPLAALSSVDTDQCTISMFSSFPNSEFTIPRPVEEGNKIKKFYRPTGEVQLVSNEGRSHFVAQGNSNSTVVHQNITNVGGEMPIQDLSVEAGGSAEQSIDANMDATIPMPLDNPPLCSGAIPVQQAFSGMAASHGVRPTVDMQLKPAALSRQHIEIFDPMETKISYLCGKKCLLTTLKLNKNMIPGTKLYEIELNTRLGVAEGAGIPINLAVLNQFVFWRADIEFELVAAMTKFHSTRIQMVCAYGSPSVDAAERNVMYSKIMNFSSSEEGTNYSDAWCVKYNQQTEFIRTYEGEKVSDKIQNYSLGSFAIFVQNSLIAPENVSSEIDLLLFVRFANVKVAVPRPNSPFTWNGALDYRYGLIYSFDNPIINSGQIVTIERNKMALKLDALHWVGDAPGTGTYHSADPTASMRINYRATSGLIVGEKRIITKFQISSDGIVLYYDDLSEEPGAVDDQARCSDYVVPWRIVEVPIEFYAQGPVIQGEQTEQTTAEIDILPAESSTFEQTKERPNKPCKLEIGEKFEFCVSDVHEVGRRYVRIVPGNNPDLEQYMRISSTNGDIKQTIFNIGVQPWSMWKNLYCVWAGGLKYRIFDKEFVETAFVPYYNRDPLHPGVPIVDCFNGTTFQYLDKTVNTDDYSSGPLARERSYPISGTNFIDISTPFQSHFNMCYTNNTQLIAPISSGTLSIIKETEEKPILYNAMADDFRFGMYRPPEKTNFDMVAFSSGIGGFYN